jgi:hypothetical protein
MVSVQRHALALLFSAQHCIGETTYSATDKYGFASSTAALAEDVSVHEIL